MRQTIIRIRIQQLSVFLQGEVYAISLSTLRPPSLPHTFSTRLAVR